jgi:pyruvate formate lyase activating enzyme
MQDKNPTEVKKVYKLAEIARKNLKYVYEGNC